MENIGIFFGSTTRNTERVAEIINELFDKALFVGVIDVDHLETIRNFDNIIFGISTWNIGELEFTREEFFPNLDEIDFTGKKVALFGLGDQKNYSDTYLDAMGILYDKLIEKGATIIGFWPTEGYSFSDSLAVRDNKFVGLALDEDNQPDLTEKRVKKWVNLLETEFKTEKLIIKEIMR
ncbi:MAG: Flavodoxin [Candidatus Heimdallarchaeota archaeon LC_3]|nr:MAG: Flavodoxin [Candidatus Heimdallarchaeota archaeon LC_3]